MARSFTKAKLLSVFVLDGFSNSLIRRGYGAATATKSAEKGGIIGSMRNKMAPKSGKSPNKVAWVPDPVTGYYKPENINEIDAHKLLDKKFNN